MLISNPVAALQQRKEFLDGVREVARMCNWNDIDGLSEHIWDYLVRIDLSTFRILKDTGDFEEAASHWEQGMEDLRKWLSTLLGVRITYV